MLKRFILKFLFSLTTLLNWNGSQGEAGTKNGMPGPLPLFRGTAVRAYVYVRRSGRTRATTAHTASVRSRSHSSSCATTASSRLRSPQCCTENRARWFLYASPSPPLWLASGVLYATNADASDGCTCNSTQLNTFSRIRFWQFIRIFGQPNRGGSGTSQMAGGSGGHNSSRGAGATICSWIKDITGLFKWKSREAGPKWGPLGVLHFSLEGRGPLTPVEPPLQPNIVAKITTEFPSPGAINAGEVWSNTSIIILTWNKVAIETFATFY